MKESLFAEMKRFVRFTEEDSDVLAAFRPLAVAHLPEVADVFYERLRQHPDAERVFSGPEQVARLKKILVIWADRLLSGPHDEEYYDLRCRIGRTHVAVGLRQVYMFTAMNVIRESLRKIVFLELKGEDERKARVVSALHKILDLELAIMLETYREDYIDRLHRSEQQAALKRLAAIGEVAASVAHEVRNPLAGISGAVEVLRDDLPADSPRREVIREVLAQIRRLDERVRDMLIYARTVPLRLEHVDPSELIRATQSLLSEEPLMQKIAAHVTVAPGTGVHPMDRGQMQEVLVNLLRNAAEAMEGRGDLFLRAERRDDGALALIVEDSGPGVPPDRMEEIFRPFVTTRPSGTGLGLAICRRTLEVHGGSLICESGGKGARFVATLPPKASGG